MNDENSTIHEFDFGLIRDYFSFMERQGPGSNEMTLKALGFIENLTDESKLLDIGCGTGFQTMTLAQNAPGRITGLDIFPEFIEKFNENVVKHNLQHKVKGIVGSMDDLPFQKEEFDLIWAEGSIFIMGYEEGLKYWRDFLKPGGYVALTDAAWFTNERPKEIEDFWEEAYAGMGTIPEKTGVMQNAGYIPVASFVLPEICWTSLFYELQDKAEDKFLEKHKGNKAAEDFVSYQRYERELYYKYKDYYGYVFSIGKRI
ncbi:MAG: SAM-dependent methyltransferase [Marinilabiliales bacterium]|nr:MAG: SAM-dependent methyltransferase [Marinilabiliales bacterium]